MRNFLWSSNLGKVKAKLAWYKIEKPIKEGGYGLKNF